MAEMVLSLVSAEMTGVEAGATVGEETREATESRSWRLAMAASRLRSMTVRCSAVTVKVGREELLERTWEGGTMRADVAARLRESAEEGAG